MVLRPDRHAASDSDVEDDVAEMGSRGDYVRTDGVPSRAAVLFYAVRRPMIQAIALCAALLGPPQPQNKLYIAVHPGDWQSARLLSDVSRDDWIKVRFEIAVCEKDV